MKFKKLLGFVLLSFAIGCCFAGSFVKVDNVDEFGDPDGTYYFKLKTAQSGTYKNSGTTKDKKMQWDMRIEQDGTGIIYIYEKGFGIESDVTTSRRNTDYVDTSAVYNVKMKLSDNSILKYNGELIMGDSYRYNAIRVYYEGWYNKIYPDMREELAKASKIENGQVKISITGEYGSYSLGSGLDLSGDESVFYDDTLYKEGLALMEKGEYDKAIDKFKEQKTKDKAVFDYYKIQNKIDEIDYISFLQTIYDEGISLYDKGEYEKALEKFTELKKKDTKSWFDTASQIDKASKKIVEKLKTKVFKVGDILRFGIYEDKIIEWLVLDKKDSKALVISKDVLFEKAYDDMGSSVTWETCTLRSYLNNDFYNLVFTEEEKKLIAKSKIENPDNPDYGTEGGNDTEDYIFLLSIEEANRYFKTDKDRDCGKQWWLRTPGCRQDCAAYVRSDGRINFDGIYVHRSRDIYYDGGVRPALWLDLNQ